MNDEANLMQIYMYIFLLSILGTLVIFFFLFTFTNAWSID